MSVCLGGAESPQTVVSHSVTAEEAQLFADFGRKSEEIGGQGVAWWGIVG
jgi:hypothetical protein